MICFFDRDDLDGCCSGAIVKYKHPECVTVGVTYGDSVPWSMLKKGETIFVVDFSFDVHDMEILNEDYNLVYIDHHRTAMDAHRELGLKFNGMQKEGLGACALVWTFCRFEIPMPWSVVLLAEYDVWNHTKPETLPFQYGMRLQPTDPESTLWPKLFSGNSEVIIDHIIEKGRTVLEYTTKSNALYAETAAFDIVFEGLRFVVINKTLGNSALFDSVFDESKHDGMIKFGWNGNEWSFSLYSKTVDVSWIAVKHGGGGHPNACGFKAKELPFNLSSGLKVVS